MWIYELKNFKIFYFTGTLNNTFLIMDRVGIFFICLFAVTCTTPTKGDTESKLQQTCNIKCDLLHHIQTLQQQMTQETIVRLGLDAQVQELRKSFHDFVRVNSQVMNKTFEEKDALITELQRENTGMKQKLGAVEKVLASLNQTFLTKGRWL